MKDDNKYSQYLAMANIIQDLARRCPGSLFPPNYMVFDLETSGFNREFDCIIQVGICTVRDHQVQQRMAFHVKRPPGTINAKITQITGITEETNLKEGLPPEFLIPELCDLFRTYRQNGLMVVGHNLWSFDIPFMEFEFGRFDCEFRFQDNEAIDTGILFKALRLGASFREHESLRDFFKRINGIRAKGVKWSVDTCVDYMDLVRKYGIDVEDLHDAGTDAWVTHLILEEMRTRYDC